MLNDLIKISDLSIEQIENIINTAMEFKSGKFSKSLIDKNISLMFFENSTRTKISFEVAAKKLGANVINFEIGTSSVNKGETLRDTLENLYFIGINGLIIRTTEDDLISDLKSSCQYPMKYINAGSGKSSHPTQALLDYMTMKENLNTLKNKKVVIVGDIAHSRVAKSNIELLNKVGANVVICAPEYFKYENSNKVLYISDLKTAISDANVVMGLRIQKERILEAFSEADYIKNYQISSNLLEKYAPQAILMHPGPVNRDIEITSKLLDSPKGKTILHQAQNGVYIRMAILHLIFGGQQ